MSDEASGAVGATEEAAPIEAAIVPEAVIDEAAPRDDAGGEAWARFGRGLAAAGIAVGRATARAGVAIGSAVATAYNAIDPDLRRHIGELPLMGLTMLARGRAPITALPDDGANIVVFVHGLGGSPGNFFPMRGYFRLRGRSRSYAVGFDEGQPISELAARLSAFLEEVVRVNALPEHAKIDIIAHSMGGLVTRAALEDPATRARIATLVTLGTPHEGTWLARLAATTATLDLRPGSAIMERLAAQVPWPGPPSMPKLVAFWSGADMLLLPHATGQLRGAENIEVPGATHFGFLLSPKAWEQVFEALSDRAA